MQADGAGGMMSDAVDLLEGEGWVTALPDVAVLHGVLDRLDAVLDYTMPESDAALTARIREGFALLARLDAALPKALRVLDGAAHEPVLEARRHLGEDLGGRMPEDHEGLCEVLGDAAAWTGLLRGRVMALDPSLDDAP